MRTLCIYPDPRRPSIHRCTECGKTLDLCTCDNPSEHADDRLHSPEGLILARVFQVIREEGVVPYNNLLPKMARDLGELHLKLAIFNDQLRPEEKSDLEPAHVLAQEVMRLIISICKNAVLLGANGDDDYGYRPDEIFGENT